MISIEKIKEEYPLHWLVWNNDHEDLQQLLQSTEQVKLFISILMSCKIIEIPVRLYAPKFKVSLTPS